MRLVSFKKPWFPCLEKAVLVQEGGRVCRFTASAKGSLFQSLGYHVLFLDHLTFNSLPRSPLCTGILLVGVAGFWVDGMAFLA